MALPHRLARRRLIGRRRRLSVGAFALVVVGGAGCGESVTPMTDESYVEVMAQLSVAESRYIDAARSDSAKLVILDDLGVPSEDLVAFSELYGGDIGLMNRLWRRIAERVDSLNTQESRREMPPGEPEVPAAERGPP